MSNMKDREQGFERKFVLDEETRFKAAARRNKLLGMWAAEKLGKSGADAEAYAREVVASDMVGCAMHMRATSSELDENSIAVTACAIISPAPTPMM